MHADVLRQGRPARAGLTYPELILVYVGGRAASLILNQTIRCTEAKASLILNQPGHGG